MEKRTEKDFAARKRERGSINILAALEWLVLVLLIVLFVVGLVMVFIPRDGYRDEDPAPGYPFRAVVTGPMTDESAEQVKENAGIDSDVGTAEQVAP